MLKRKIGDFPSIFFFMVGILVSGQSVAAVDGAQESKSPAQDDYFAIVNQQKISAAEYGYRFRKSLNEKFFHGKVTQGEMDAFKKQVAEQIIMEVLLGQEARKRGLQLDTGKIAQELERLDKKFSDAKDQDDWDENRDQVLPILKAGIERESLVKQLQEQVNNIAQPPRQDVKKYYEDNKEKFTEPQQWDVSMILLSVDPASTSDVWEETVEKAEKILKKIHKGESFEEMARIHSGDESAVMGGHMGYTHIGMLGTPAQKVLNVMAPGELSEPVVLLEGVALFRLNGVREASLNAFEDVEERAKNLLMRDLSEKAWQDMQTELRQSADIKYSDFIIKDLKLESGSES